MKFKRRHAKILATGASVFMSVGVMGFAVLAASSQTFSTTGTVGFTSSHVSCSVDAKLSQFVGSTETVYANFKASAAADDTTLQVEENNGWDGDSKEANVQDSSWEFDQGGASNVTFEGLVDEKLVFSYVFENLGSERSMNVVITDSSDSAQNFGFGSDSNVSTSFSITGAEIGNTTSAPTSNKISLTVGEGETATLTITHMVENVGVSVQPKSFEFDCSIKDENAPQDADFSLSSPIVNQAFASENPNYAINVENNVIQEIPVPVKSLSTVQNVSSGLSFAAAALSTGAQTCETTHYAFMGWFKKSPKQVGDELIFDESSKIKVGDQVLGTESLFAKWLVPTSGMQVEDLGDDLVKITRGVNEPNCVVPSTVTVGGSIVNISEIGENAFASFSSLQTVTLPESLMAIGDGAFENCSNLEQVNFNANIETIGESAFANTSAIDEISLPATLTSMGTGALYRSSKIINFAGTMSQFTSLGSNEFTESGVFEDYSVVTGYDVTVNCSDATQIFETLEGNDTMSCFVGGTMITVVETYTDKNGKKRKRKRKKKIEDITYDDDILCFDFDEGKFTTAKPCWIKKKNVSQNVSRITLSNGETVDVVGNHVFFNATKNKFNNCIDLDFKIGTKVFLADGKTAHVVKIEKIAEKAESFSIVTDFHMNCFANNILTSTHFNNLFEIENMKFKKDGRKLRKESEFKTISKEVFNSFRLAENNKLTAKMIETNLAQYMANKKEN